MQPINISVTAGPNVNLLEVNVSNVDPLEDYSLVEVTTTQDGFNFRQEFWMRNSVLPLKAEVMKDLRAGMRLKVAKKLKEHREKIKAEAK